LSRKRKKRGTTLSNTSIAAQYKYQREKKKGHDHLIGLEQTLVG
jgi:hypothetical protein